MQSGLRLRCRLFDASATIRILLWDVRLPGAGCITLEPHPSRIWLRPTGGQPCRDPLPDWFRGNGESRSSAREQFSPVAVQFHGIEGRCPFVCCERRIVTALPSNGKSYYLNLGNKCRKGGLWTLVTKVGTHVAF